MTPSTIEDPKLAELDPRFRQRVGEVLSELFARGWQPKIASGLRTLEQQAEKVRRGASRTLQSMHTLGLAADIIDRRHGWSGPARSHDFAFWVDLGRLAKQRGLVWGGDWKGFRDVAHIEWTDHDLQSRSHE